VRSHDGAIIVQSTPSAGTSVRVLFPLVVQAVKAPNGELEIMPAPHSAPLGGPTRQANSAWPHVLVADDEPMVRSMCQALLEEWGYSPLLAGDGEEAVALFKAHVDRIACVILDLTMPRLDGLGALKAMREVQPGVHVVLSSGYSQREAMQRFGNDGVTMFIQKPYRAQSLRQILEKVASHAD
jgi:CheY-like chemotaxis protein